MFTHQVGRVAQFKFQLMLNVSRKFLLLVDVCLSDKALNKARNVVSLML